jgi:ACR3 family arsenite efflux pump ArsB
MLSHLKKVQTHLIVVIPVVMVAGFFAGLAVNPAPLKQLILPLTFLMVYPMMINLQLKKVLEGGDLKVQVVTQLLNFAILPFIAFGIGKIAFPDAPYVALGLLLASLLPTSGMTISWTGMAKGNMAAAVKMTVFGLLIGSILTPIYIKFLMGTTIEIPMAKIFQQILMVVLLPLILGNLTQRALIRRYGLAHYQKDLKPIFPPFSTLGVVGIVFVAMALKANSIVSNPGQLITLTLPLLVLYGLSVTELDVQSLPEALDSLARRMEQIFDINIEINAGEDLPQLSATENNHIYRIVREAVFNANRHGKAPHIWIDAIHEKTRLVLSVTNDGLPVPNPAPPGFGTRQIQMRTRLLNGRFSLTQKSERKTVAELIVPLFGKES